MLLKVRIPCEEDNFDFLVGIGLVQINKPEDLIFQYKVLIFLIL